MRKQGTVIMWKGQWGFIGGPDTRDGGDIFFHATELYRAGHQNIQPGQKVEFEMGTNVKNGRPCAVKLELLDPILVPVDEKRSAAHERANMTFTACPDRVVRWGC